MFTREEYEIYEFEKVPVGGDIFVFSDKWMDDYARMMDLFLDGEAEYENIGYVSYFSVRSIQEDHLEMSWIANMSDRYHEVPVTLPKSQFVVCVSSRKCDERPRIFATEEWVRNLYLCNYSVFALVDAIGFRTALTSERVDADNLLRLRNSLDQIAARYPDMLFFSFADSLIIKGNWTVGTWDSDVSYTYEPEKYIGAVKDIAAAYQENLGLKSYGILTQGQNNYYGSELSHVSPEKNHISLNSLGIPFEKLMAIETAVKKAIKNGTHAPAELYLEEEFYRSMNLPYKYKDEHFARELFYSKMRIEPGKYHPTSCEEILKAIEAEAIIEKNKQKERKRRSL